MAHSNEKRHLLPLPLALNSLTLCPALAAFPFTCICLLILGAGSLSTSMLIADSLLPAPLSRMLRTWELTPTPSVLCLAASQPFPLQDFILLPPRDSAWPYLWPHHSELFHFQGPKLCDSLPSPVPRVLIPLMPLRRAGLRPSPG